MAVVSNLSLEMGRNSDGLEFAHVNCDVEFTVREVRENLEYTVFIVLFEVDNGRDIYHFFNNGHSLQPAFEQTARGDKDDFIRFFSGQTIQPDGRASVTIDRIEEFNIGNQEAGNEEYEATVLVIPEITQGFARSSTVSINLG